MKVNNLQELLVDELKDILNAETQLTKALPKLARQCDSEELRMALEEHLEQTKTQKDRVESILTELTGSARGKACKGMQGIIEEGNDMLDEIEDPDTTDAAIIAACQKVEHYEMASYGCARTWARSLGLDEVADQLQEILDEEGEADKKLTVIAESFANRQAAEGEGGDDEESGMEESEDEETRQSAGVRGKSQGSTSRGRGATQATRSRKTRTTA